MHQLNTSTTKFLNSCFPHRKDTTSFAGTMTATDIYRLPETFAHDGWSIRYLVQSSTNSSPSGSPNPWIVFIHGTPWSSAVFRPLANALLATGSFDVVLYDLAGYGQSQVFDRSQARSEPNTSVKAQGELLAAFLKHLHLDGKDGDVEETPYVVAHDIAGVISMRAHLLHGCEYRSLCLLDTNCVLPWGDKLYSHFRANSAVFEELPGGVFEGCLRSIIQSARAKGRGLGPEWEDVLARPWLTGGDGADDTLEYDPQKNFVRQIKQSDDDHTAELLDGGLYSEVRCDVKILWGEEDGWIPYDKMQALAKLLGYRLKEFVTVPEAGHLIMLDQPERVALEIFGWLHRQS